MLDETYRAEQRHFWFKGFRRFIRPFITAAVAGVERPRMLDCGSGTGSNLEFLRQFGTPFGIDLTWRGLELAHARGCSRLAQARVEALPFPNAVFDATLSFDVLYCLEDQAERQAIAEMHRVLRPGGGAVINVAALDMLKGDHSELVSEVRRYTRRQLAAKLEPVGFRVERITYTNATLFPIAAVARALQRVRGVKSGGGPRGDFYVPPAPVNAVFSGALMLEASLITAGLNMPIGSSVLCVARKI